MQREDKTILKYAFLVLVGCLMVSGNHHVEAAVRGDTTPKATNGAVQILASAATQVFTGMTGRNSYAIFNHGPNTIWCGFQNTVSNTTGFPVGPETSLNVDLVYNNSGDKDFYCRADTADQVSPLDSRWIQVK